MIFELQHLEGINIEEEHFQHDMLTYISGPWIQWQTGIIPLCISAPGTYILVCEICVQLQNTQIFCPHAVTVGIALKGNLKVIQALIMIKISVKPSLIRAKEVKIHI
jgi:hypothetical protein